MVEQAPRRERQDAVMNRARILATAQDLFAREGVESVSMNRIAQVAEVGTGTLYRHFGNKSDLCFALIQDQIIMLADELSALVAACDDECRVTFEELVLRHQRFKESKSALFKCMQEAVSHTDGPTQSPVYETLREPFVALFEKAAIAEGIDQPLDAEFRADMLLAVLIGKSLRHQRVERGLSLEDYARGICEVFYPRP